MAKSCPGALVVFMSDQDYIELFLNTLFSGRDARPVVYIRSRLVAVDVVYVGGPMGPHLTRQKTIK